MRKLKLAISNDDECLQEGGALATKTWKIGSIAVSALSGYDRDFQGTQTGACPPYVALHSSGGLYEGVDYRKPFDMALFEKALEEARKG